MESKQPPKQKTIYPGVRYRDYSIRKLTGKSDRYFFIRYRYQRKLKEEGVGWSSEGWNAQKTSRVLAKLKESIKIGEGPQTLAHRRLILKEREEAQQAEKEKQARESISFESIFLNIYSPQAKDNKGKETYRREQNLFKEWISPVIGGIPLKDISPFNLERIKKNMADADRAPRTIRYALAVVRQVYNFAKFNNLFPGESPTAKVKMPQEDNRRYRYLTHGEADQLLKSLSLKSRQMYEMALISLHCGLRAGEIFSLTWGDLDFENGSMFIKDTKPHRNRTAFMTNAVKEMLELKKRGQNDDFIFHGHGTPGITGVSRTFERVIKDLGFNTGVTDRRQKVVFHTLRHTYASWLVENGVDLYTVKKLMGHSTIAMTERYSHLGNNTLQNAVRVFEGSLKERKEAAVAADKKQNG